MPEAPITIAVVMACFNRRETTLKCLRNLGAQQAPGIQINTYLLDDASPDGTAAAVRSGHPEVTVLDGTGRCFWGGGMHRAMKAAADAPFDFMLWLNDDVELMPDGVERLLRAHEEAARRDPGRHHLIVGPMQNPQTGELTYAGFTRRNRWHPAQLVRVKPAKDDLTPCDTMNGNCVLIPARMVQLIGLIDPTFVQQLGDIDYGYRACKAGARIWVAPGAVGFCRDDNRPRPRPWQDRTLSIAARWRSLNSPHGTPLRPWLKFMWTYAGVLGAALLALSYVKTLAASPPKTA